MEIINENRPRRLYRSRDKVIAGVCGGVADYLNIDPTVIRVITVIGFFIPFFPVVIPYIVMSLVIPMEP